MSCVCVCVCVCVIQAFRVLSRATSRGRGATNQPTIPRDGIVLD